MYLYMNMKKIIRLTESDLLGIIQNAVKKAVNEDMLGNDWNATAMNKDVANNYEAFDDQMTDDLPFDLDGGDYDDHDWSGVGEEDIDPSYYEDPDAYKDYDDHDPSDNELYNYGNW